MEACPMCDEGDGQRLRLTQIRLVDAIGQSRGRGFVEEAQGVEPWRVAASR